MQFFLPHGSKFLISYFAWLVLRRWLLFRLVRKCKSASADERHEWRRLSTLIFTVGLKFVQQTLTFSLISSSLQTQNLHKVCLHAGKKYFKYEYADARKYYMSHDSFYLINSIKLALIFLIWDKMSRLFKKTGRPHFSLWRDSTQLNTSCLQYNAKHNA